MTRYVIGPDVAIRLSHRQAVIRGGYQILVPALLRFQVLSLLRTWPAAAVDTSLYVVAGTIIAATTSPAWA